MPMSAMIRSSTSTRTVFGRVGYSVNVQWGPLNVQIGGGVAIDTQGNIGFYKYLGPGTTTGAGELFSGGISFHGSRAPTICDLKTGLRTKVSVRAMG